MKASELRPGQWFECYRNSDTYRCQCLGRCEDNEPWTIAYVFKDTNEQRGFGVDACQPSAPVTPLNVHGWDEPQSEPAPTLQGEWPANCLQRAFVEGAKWWEYQCESATMWQSDRNLVEQEAVRRYGEVRPDPTEEKVKPAPLQLREGARFLMRQQGETGPLHKVDQEDYVWSDGKNSWTAEGKYWASGWDSPYDLIAEVPPPVEPTPEQWQTADGPNHKCPLGLDDTEQICSAGICDKCRRHWSGKYAVALPEPPPVEPEQFKEGDWLYCCVGFGDFERGHVYQHAGKTVPPSWLAPNFRRATPAEVEKYKQSIRGLGAKDETPPRPAVQPDAAGWMKHDGTGCPLPVGATVKARQRNGHECAFAVSSQSHKPGSDWFWSEMYNQYDIVAYRLPITHWVEVVGL